MLKNLMLLIAVGVVVWIQLLAGGCGGEERRLVGTYMGDRDGAILELKGDGSYRYEVKGDNLIPGSVKTGEWIAETEDGTTSIVLTPMPALGAAFLCRKKGDRNLISYEPTFGQTYVRQ